MAVRLVTSPSAVARLDAVGRFLSSYAPGTEIVIVGASRGAVDDLVRRMTSASGATFGLVRLGFTELAARLSATAGREAPRTAVTLTGAEAAATRAVFAATTGGPDGPGLQYFDPVARLPGFPKALARTAYELRLSGVDSGQLADRSAAMSDLARLLDGVVAQLDASSVADRAALFEAAARECASTADHAARWLGRPLVLLDVPLDSRVEAEFARALVARSVEAVVTVPDGDERTSAELSMLNPRVEPADDPAPRDSDLHHLRRFIFNPERPAPRAPAGDVRLFSAPGEAREAIEVVRRVLDEAASGVAFDEMAVLLRAPQQYLGLVEHACARGGVPVYFDRGTRRPDPAGRAFLALLACAAEGLSAKRFDEYLSLGQVPRLDESTRHQAALADPVPPRDEAYAELDADPERAWWESAAAEEEVGSDAVADSDENAIVSGTLRAPWKWEELVVESAVVAGRNRADGAARWRRRLRGLGGEFEEQLRVLQRDDPESGRVGRLRRDLRNLDHLTRFALPLIDALAAWPDRASWGEWLDRFTTLAAKAIRQPRRVQQVLAELRPMAEVSGVDLDEARRVLHDRLATLDWDPPARRYGCLFVGTPHQARGRRFRVVFVPGLAERVVPQRPREDPLLLDDRRAQLCDDLVRQDDRATAERLLLKLSLGAASERVYLSYPRLDSAGEGRARVPSFYALDVMRAITGRVPDHRRLGQEAAEEAGASLGWPAPRDPDRAIDHLEHDLAVLRPLLESRDVAGVKGRAHYLLDLNAALKRSITTRWLRDRKAWAAGDGLTGATPSLAPYLSRQRLTARPYSLSALQRFAVCPYQFLLATVHRLEAWVEPEPLVRLDPLTRGSLFHEVQTRFQRTLHAQQALPIAPERMTGAVKTLEAVLAEVAAEYEERLAPAIPRVWADEIDDLRRDLSIWVQRMALETEWIPEYFELSFGLSDSGRDPRSLPDAVTIDGGYRLRGSIDLVERHAHRDVLRVTDHKTGRNRSNADLVVGGGTVLQPVLYSMIVERALGKPVETGRLYYATTVGGFFPHPIDLTDYTRAQGLQVLTIIDRAIGEGFLVAAPQERACAWCDFRPVCGPGEENRVKRKSADRLADLHELRSMR